MNVLILTALWRRPALTSFVLKYYNSLKAELYAEGIVLKLWAVGSEGETSRKIATEAGWHYVEAPNEPLFEKWQALMTTIKKNRRGIHPDVYIVVGSDNLINAAYIRYCCYAVKSGQDFGQPDGCVFVDLPSGKSSFLKGFQGGAGRMFSERLAQQSDYTFWVQNPAYSVDHWQYRHITEDVIPRDSLKGRMILVPVRLSAPAQLIDIKSEQNIWPWDDFSPERNPMCSAVNTERYLTDYFPEVLDLGPSIYTRRDDSGEGALLTTGD